MFGSLPSDINITDGQMCTVTFTLLSSYRVRSFIAVLTTRAIQTIPSVLCRGTDELRGKHFALDWD